MKKFAFTMAEILISLTIIGIIAAITLPALQSNINEKTWNTQRKALFSRMTQAISMMPSLNGLGIDYSDASSAFVAELGKTLKINNVCDQEHLLDCGIDAVDSAHFKVNNLKGTQVNINVKAIETTFAENSIIYGTAVDSNDTNDYNIYAAGFETVNGESIMVHYNPYCVGNNARTDVPNTIYNKVCANFVYDLNGRKGPNTIGKDVGIMTAFYSSDSVVVAPMPLANYDKGNFSDASSACRQMDEDSRMPNLEEAMSIRLNFTLFTDEAASDGWVAWTNKVLDAERAWAYGKDGRYWTLPKDAGDNYVWCVKR